MLNYNDQPCPGCGKHLHDDDDIVVCPVCATPQHRECWLAEGHCANESLHSEGFVWTPREKVSLDEPSEDVKLCHICSAQNPADALHCEKCGALLSQEKQEENAEERECRFCGQMNPSSSRLCTKCGAPLLFENNFFQNNIYMRGVNASEDEELGNTTVGDAAYFVQGSARRYIPKFKRLASGKKISFNLAAFVFSPWWFFYRKLYKAGIIFLVLFTSITLMTFRLQAQVVTATEAMEAQLSEIQEQYKDATGEDAMNEALSKQNEVVKKFVGQARRPAAIILAITLFEHLICGFSANLIYYKRMTDIINKVEEAKAPDEIKKSLLIRAGGISFISLAAGLLGGEVLTYFISYIAQTILGSM